jgi:integrase
MSTPLRKAPGMRERSPGVWELFVQAGVDPVTGKRRQVSRVFRGNLRDAKKARAELLAEVGKGRHTGTAATVDHLATDWLVELERKGRSPNTIHAYRSTYNRNIKATLGNVPVPKVTTKMLTDLYGAHQRRGLKPRTVYQIHATLSSMFTQACRWGWRDSNPAQWAEPPSADNVAPVVPTPEEVMALINEASASRRPEKSRAMFIAATTGMRRAEICALRRDRDIDWERAIVTVTRSIVVLPKAAPAEIPTKNRRIRPVALDELTLSMLCEQRTFIEERAASAGVALVDDPYLFSDEADGSAPWRPDSVTRFFTRVRQRVGLEHINFHDLRKFMETYAQDLGFTPAAVAMRAGHDPSVMSKHYTGRIEEADRALATAVAALISPPRDAADDAMAVGFSHR